MFVHISTTLPVIIGQILQENLLKPIRKANQAFGGHLFTL
jgi:hypothetical protein